MVKNISLGGCDCIERCDAYVMLALGGAAIVVGLLLYGYKVIKTIGYKLTMISPSRGFSAELGASLVVVTA